MTSTNLYKTWCITECC